MQALEKLLPGAACLFLLLRSATRVPVRQETLTLFSDTGVGSLEPRISVAGPGEAFVQLGDAQGWALATFQNDDSVVASPLWDSWLADFVR